MFSKSKNTPRHNHRLFKKLLAPAILFGATAVGTNSVYAAYCSPLSVTSVRPVDTRPVVVNGYTKGVSFRLLATVKNTNRNLSYQPHRDNLLSFTVNSAGGVKSLHRHIANVPMDRAINGGQARVVSSGRYEVFRTSDQFNFKAKFQAIVLNHQCNTEYPNDWIGISTFTYDLIPALSERTAKRVSGRITGANEARAPRPRPAGSTGAPRPRSRS